MQALVTIRVPSQQPLGTWDYVIVGAGTAVVPGDRGGIVVAGTTLKVPLEAE